MGQGLTLSPMEKLSCVPLNILSSVHGFNRTKANSEANMTNIKTICPLPLWCGDIKNVVLL